MVYNKDPILPFEYKEKLDIFWWVFGLWKSDIENLSENDFSCKRLDPFYPQDGPLDHSTPIHTPIQSQLVIIPSKDGACSIMSDESSLIDVGVWSIHGETLM